MEPLARRPDLSSRNSRSPSSKPGFLDIPIDELKKQRQQAHVSDFLFPPPSFSYLAMKSGNLGVDRKSVVLEWIIPERWLT